MTSLYESILKSVGSGKDRIAAQVLEWFKITQYYAFRIAGSKYIKPEEIEFTPMSGNSWKIDIKSNGGGEFQSWQFERADTKGTGKMPYIIHSVCCDGKPVNITYKDLDFKDTSEMVQEVENSLTFNGCEITKIDKLPKGCENLTFGYSHRLGGGTGCKVGSIEKISLYTLSITNGGHEKLGLSCRLSNIKGITVRSRMEICDYMLGYFCLEKGNRKFKEDASKMIDEFLKDNKVKDISIMFWSEDNNSGMIEFDKKINRWRFKPYKS